MALKIIQKALGKQGFQSGETRTDKPFESLGENKVLRRRKRDRKIHYKPCGIQCLLEPTIGNGTQNLSKSTRETMF